MKKKTVVLCFGVLADNVSVTKKVPATVTMKHRKTRKVNETGLSVVVLEGNTYADLRKRVNEYVDEIIEKDKAFRKRKAVITPGTCFGMYDAKDKACKKDMVWRHCKAVKERMFVVS